MTSLSVTVLDLNGGRITNIAYGSAAPVDRQLGDLRLPAGEKTSLTDFLSALRGARLEVRSGANSITGRLLSVERKTRIAGGTTLEVDYLSLITETGELRTTELSPSFSVRMLDRGLAAKVDRFLDIIATARQSDVRRMVLSASGSGERSIFVSYISEVPIWKSTYRLVFNPKAGQKPLLQGWAIVDNTVGQDWENVELSLVAGAPQSFVQNLSQPYYARRPVVPLPESANMAPQTYESTLITGGGRILLDEYLTRLEQFSLMQRSRHLTRAGRLSEKPRQILKEFTICRDCRKVPFACRSIRRASVVALSRTWLLQPRRRMFEMYASMWAV